MSETVGPLIMREGVDSPMPGRRIECENGHFIATVGNVATKFGWPNLLSEDGSDITRRFAGRPFPILCGLCGAVAIDQIPSNPDRRET